MIGVEEPVIAQVIVRVRHQDVEDDAPPELAQVFPRGRTVPAQCVGDVRVGARLALGCAQQAHGGQEGHPVTAAPVEALDDQHRLPGDPLEAP